MATKEIRQLGNFRGQKIRNIADPTEEMDGVNKRYVDALVAGGGSIIFKGVYSDVTTYAAGDSVDYNGSSYVAIQETIGNIPTNTTYWQVLASKGDIGVKGDTGDKGDKGDTGAAGGVTSINGATGIVTLDIDDVAPLQTGNSGKVLTTDGTNATWGSSSGGATLDQIYPIGTIYTNKTDSRNPSVIFGIGTWAAIAGKVVVGLDSGQTEFDTAGETGGEKTHTLIESEMPVHTHLQNSHNHPQDPHTHFGNGSTSGSGLAGVTGPLSTNPRNVSTTTATNQASTAVNQNAGSSSAHNNLQPYVVCYVWERTA